jgi:hypothetical protein
MTPSPTQFRPLFFAILSMQAFVLAIYSILIYHNHLDPQVKILATGKLNSGKSDRVGNKWHHKSDVNKLNQK